MATHERRTDRAADATRRILATTGREIRQARTGLGLSLRVVASAADTSAASVSRIERAMAHAVPLDVLVRLATLVGLDLSVRLFPGPHPLRDAAQVDLLAAFRARLDHSLGFGSEVPLPIQGDQRRWDGLVSGRGWRLGVEVETAPRDWQDLTGRLARKQRDGDVDAVILVLPESRRSREFLAAAAAFVPTVFPVNARTALMRLGAGEHPGGSAVVVLRRNLGQGVVATP